jgi:TonB family protein
MARTKPVLPSVVQAVVPIYPPLAVSAGESGTVFVEVRINPRGTVTSARSIAGIKLLGKAAEDSARHWVFTASSENTDVRVVRLIFTFKIIPENAAPGDFMPLFKPPYQVEARVQAPKVINNPNAGTPISRQSSRTRKKRREITMAKN